jgi:hypothetical protein
VERLEKEVVRLVGIFASCHAGEYAKNGAERQV